MRLLKAVAVMIAVVALPLWAMTTAAHDGPGSPDQCPEYGCDVKLVPLASGGFVLMGEARFPMTWYNTPPDRVAQVWLDGEVLQSIPIRWGSLDYFCCCPSEMYGDFADILSPIAKPGDELRVVVGSYEVCETVLEVPAGIAPDDDAPASPASRGRTRSN